jgi:hypothetical protein
MLIAPRVSRLLFSAGPTSSKLAIMLHEEFPLAARSWLRRPRSVAGKARLR